LVAEETTVLDAQAATQVIREFKMASIDAYFSAMEKRSAEFLDATDFNLLKALFGQTDRAKQLIATEESAFHAQQCASPLQ
jgi:putative heme iron utilization protein